MIHLRIVNRLLIFAKAQASAIIGGAFDYGVMVGLTELAGLHYTLSIAIGCALGAALNFSLNRYWSFYQRNGIFKFSTKQQIVRFVLTAASSIVLKMAGTYLLTTLAGVDYKISRIVTDMLVSIGYSYVLQRFWVFKTAEKCMANA
ncbi:MAG: GtrA family protein [Prevotellaceae bacterium]|jgi:putative flippase GtrA|nr:GtrA family protein [Prevotellaceae bacterium]